MFVDADLSFMRWKNASISTRSSINKKMKLDSIAQFVQLIRLWRSQKNWIFCCACSIGRENSFEIIVPHDFCPYPWWLLTCIRMQFQLTVEEIHEASSGNDFSMWIVQASSTDAHVFTIDALRAGSDRYHFCCFQIQIICHHNSSQHFSSTIILNVDGRFGKLLQYQSEEKKNAFLAIPKKWNEKCCQNATFKRK